MLEKPKIVKDWEESMPRCCFTCISFESGHCNFFHEDIPEYFTSKTDACDCFMSFKECPF